MNQTTFSSQWGPDFVGIGAEKSATTWAWSQLEAHPNIEMSQPKELNFFNQHFERGLDWYQKHFTGTHGCLQGEISPLYMDCPAAADRMACLNPDLRLLVMLRDPFDRALSHLMHDAQNVYGGVADVSADDLRTLALRDDKYVRRSCYFQGLTPYLDAFPREQLGIFFFDDVADDPETLVRRMYFFVGADSSFVPENLTEKINRTKDYRSVVLYRVIRGISTSANAFAPTRLAMEWVYRNTRLREKTLDLLMVDEGRPPLTPQDVLPEDQLLRIQQDYEQLNRIIDMPVSWQQSRSLSAA